MDLAASIQAVTEEIVLRLTRTLARETGARESVPRRRRGAQLRRQRQGAARRHVRAHLDSAGGRRRRRRARAPRSPPIIIYKDGRAAPPEQLDGMQGAYLGPAFDAGRDRAAPGQLPARGSPCWTTTR